MQIPLGEHDHVVTKNLNAFRNEPADQKDSDNDDNEQNAADDQNIEQKLVCGHIERRARFSGKNHAGNLTLLLDRDVVTIIILSADIDISGKV